MRIKAIIYVMCSSGIRLCAWNYLKWKHIIPKWNDKGELVAANLLVYKGEPEEYYTFITPEAYNTIKDRIDFRMSYGEVVSGKSIIANGLIYDIGVEVLTFSEVTSDFMSSIVPDIL